MLAGGLTALLASLALEGDAASPEAGPFDMERVRFSRLSGELEIQVTTSAEGATLQLDGPDTLVAAVELEADGGLAANLGLNGVGSIRVAKVEQLSQVRVNGIGAIEVSNW